MFFGWHWLFLFLCPEHRVSSCSSRNLLFGSQRIIHLSSFLSIESLTLSENWSCRAWSIKSRNGCLDVQINLVIKFTECMTKLVQKLSPPSGVFCINSSVVFGWFYPSASDKMSQIFEAVSCSVLDLLYM